MNLGTIGLLLGFGAALCALVAAVLIAEHPCQEHDPGIFIEGPGLVAGCGHRL